jgi:hypothetical protein
MTEAIIIGEAPALDSREPLDGRVGRRLERLAGLGEGELPYVFALGNLLPEYPGRKPRRPGPHNSPGDRFDLEAARRNWRGFVDDVLETGEFGIVILLGRNAARAAGLARAPFFAWMPVAGAEVAVFPHPSGTSHFWNDRANVVLAEAFLREVVVRLDDRVDATKRGRP